MSNLFDWQKGGFSKGELSILMASRSTGKSMFSGSQTIRIIKNRMSVPERKKVWYKKIDSAEVDGEPWVTVACSKEVSEWLRTNDKDQWCELAGGDAYYLEKFDMTERLFVMLSIKWSEPPSINEDIANYSINSFQLTP